MLTPHLYPIDLRVKCAANQKNLWHRFCLYYKAKKPGFLMKPKKVYPTPNKWCNSMLQAYHRTAKMSEESIIRLQICPKVGWNKYGGPELFTFDNHEPRGGCVLLNDGTVKFIRTTEELRQLRWK
jgi:hypothetical protein